MTSRLSFVSNNGITFPFDNSERIQLVDLADGLFTIPTDLIIDQTVNGDGGRLVQLRRSPRRITLNLMVTDSPADVELEDAIQIWGRLSAGLAAGGILQFDGPNGVRELRDVRLESAVRSQDGRANTMTASLLALDPWWYGELQNVAGTFGAPTPWNDSIPWDSSIPWNGGASETLVVAGDAPALPIVVITGAATQVAFSVGGRGGWEIDATIPSGTYVTVSNEVGRAGPHRGPHGFYPAPDGPIEWPLLREGSQLFTLPVGMPTVVFSASGTDGNSAWEIFWHPRFLSP